MPAPNVSPPAMRSAPSPVSAPETHARQRAGAPVVERRVDAARRSPPAASTSSAARPSSSWIAMSRSMLARRSASSRAAICADGSARACVRAGVRQAERAAEPGRERLASAAATRSHGGLRDRSGERGHRRVELVHAPVAPGLRQPREGRPRGSGSQRLDRGEERELLHPAAGERVEREHLAHVRGVGERRTPARRYPRPRRRARAGGPVWLSSTSTGLPTHSSTSSSDAR